MTVPISDPAEPDAGTAAPAGADAGADAGVDAGVAAGTATGPAGFAAEASAGLAGAVAGVPAGDDAVANAGASAEAASAGAGVASAGADAGVPAGPGEGVRAEDDSGEIASAGGGQDEDADPPGGSDRNGAGRSGGYDSGEWRGIVLVTGTDTEVGKTVVTAAVAAAAAAAGLRVAVLKPGQTGTADGEMSDVETVVRLARPATARTLSAYPDPLAPLVAARVRGMAPLELYAVVDAVRAEAEAHDLVLVEGAGGLLVPMGLRPSGQPWTFADLAVSLGGPAIVVTRAGLGTLNHTALTMEALDRRGVSAGVVIGAWPTKPGLVHWANFTDLVPRLLGALPAGAGGMDPGVFQRSAPGWLTPHLYGVLDDWRAWAEEG